MKYKLETLADTQRLAWDVAEQTGPGNLLVLSGPLGAGKTTFTQQLGVALKSKANISSPTYTLIHEYPTPQGTLVHIDAYRLDSTDALFEFGLDDYLDRARLVVVEWGEGLLEHFPDALHIHLNLEQDTRTAALNRPLTPDP